MKKVKIKWMFLLWMFGCLSMYGQTNNFAPIGAVWHYNNAGFCGPSGSMLINGYQTITCMADTVIGGNTCRKLVYRDVNGSFLQNKYLYENAGIVYHYFNNAFYALYDYTAQQGDTVQLGLIGQTASFNDTLYQVSLVVDSIYTDSSGSMPLHRYELSELSTGSFFYSYTESIGYERALIFDHWTVAFIGCTSFMRCYEDTTLNYRGATFPDTLACDYMPMTNVRGTNTVYASFDVFPNPFQDQLTIKWEGSLEAPIQVVIYNSVGQLMQQSVETNQRLVQVPISAKWPQGLYYVQLLVDNQVVGSRKVVKE